MDTLDLVIVELARDLLVTTLLIAGPILVVGLVVGLAVSLFQALTSVQEQTMSLIPKMFAVMGVALLLLAPMLQVLRDYAERVFSQLADFVEGKAAIPPKSVVLTIDDGYKSAYDVAYPRARACWLDNPEHNPFQQIPTFINVDHHHAPDGAIFDVAAAINADWPG